MAVLPVIYMAAMTQSSGRITWMKMATGSRIKRRKRIYRNIVEERLHEHWVGVTLGACLTRSRALYICQGLFFVSTLSNWNPVMSFVLMFSGPSKYEVGIVLPFSFFFSFSFWFCNKIYKF